MKTKIVTLVKDEHEYINEWIDYHLQLGFDQIDVYEDFGSRSHLDAVSQYPNVHVCKIADKLPEITQQPNADRYGILLEKTLVEDENDFDWTLCIDVDEYLFMAEDYTLQSFLSGYSSFPGIYLYWKYMSANKHVHKCKSVLTSYTSESAFSKQYINQFKCFFNLKKNFLCHEHCHHRAKYGVDTSKNLVFPDRKTQNKLFNKAWINHYYTKSWEDWCSRIYDKGNLTYGIRRLMHFFYYNEDMLCMKDRLLQTVFGRRPKCSIWLDSDDTMLFTGKTVDKQTSIYLNNIVKADGLLPAQDYVEKHFGN